MAELVSLIPKWRLKKYGQEAFQSNVVSNQHVLDQVSGVAEFGRVIAYADSLPVLTLWGQGTGPSLLVKGSSVAEYRFEETDQTDPAGRYRFIVTGDKIYLQRAASANWASSSLLAHFAPNDVNIADKFYIQASYVILNESLQFYDNHEIVVGSSFCIKPYATNAWALKGKYGSSYKTVAQISAHPTLASNVYLELWDARLFGPLIGMGQDIEDIDLLEADQIALRNAEIDMFNIKTDKVTREDGSSLFNASGTTDSSTVWTQPAGTVLLGVKIRLEEQFVASGMTDLDVTIGDAGDNDGLLLASMNLTSDPLDTEYTTRGVYWDEASGVGFLIKDAATDWIAYATSVGADLDTLTAGAIDFYFTYLEQ